MKELVSLECRKAIRGRGFWAALLIGLVIAGADIFHQYIYGNNVYGEDLYSLGEYYAGSCYGQWMGMDIGNVFGRLFVFLIPFLAALPYATSYCEERKNGYLRQMVTRVGKRNYLLAKVVAVFFSGMLVVMIPLMTNFIALAMKSPLRYPVPLLTTVAPYEDPRILFNFRHPFLYTWGYILLDGVVGGIMAAFALVPASFSDSQLTVWAFPMVASLILTRYCQAVSWTAGIMSYYLFAGFAATIDPLGVLVQMLVVLGIIFLLYFIRGCRKEIF